jgi:hypothetical protein
MAGARDIYADLFKEASASEEVELVKEALGPLGKALALSGAGLGGGLIGLTAGKHIAQQKAEEEAARQKALVFGAGALSGLVAPSLLKKLKGVAGTGLGPGDAYYDEFTEF